MRIAIFIRGGEFKFYELDESTLEAFKKKYAAKQWRIVDISTCANKGDAVALCKKTIRERVRKIKYANGRKKLKSTSEMEKEDKRAYRLIGATKQYAKICRKLDATKLVGTRIF